MADVVDTGLFRAKELGVTFIRRDAAMFLERQGAESIFIELADVLEDFLVAAGALLAA